MAGPGQRFGFLIVNVTVSGVVATMP